MYHNLTARCTSHPSHPPDSIADCATPTAKHAKHVCRNGSKRLFSDDTARISREHRARSTRRRRHRCNTLARIRPARGHHVFRRTRVVRPALGPAGRDSQEEALRVPVPGRLRRAVGGGGDVGLAAAQELVGAVYNAINRAGAICISAECSLCVTEASERRSPAVCAELRNARRVCGGGPALTTPCTLP